MSVFKFKQFEVIQAASAMKIGTDSVLLGCLLEHQNPATILDIGTGTGLLALMMAQRFGDATIDAVEIDAETVSEASKNFAQGNWHKRIQLYHQSFQLFAETITKEYDLIVSNPPYYTVQNHFAIAEVQRSTARHTGELSFDDLLIGIKNKLSAEGSCWMVLPSDVSELVMSKAIEINLFVTHKIEILPKLSKPSNRVVFCLSKTFENVNTKQFVIYHEDGSYTQEYKEATFPFLLWEKETKL